jgi:hypothetical protein
VDGSHSRHTTKFDQRPTGVHRTSRARVEFGDYTTRQRKAMKKLQKRKQRAWDKIQSLERED